MPTNMNILYKSSFLVLWGLLTFSTSWAQSIDQWIEAADASFEREDYYSASQYYDAALKYDTSRVELWYRLGESYLNFTAYQRALTAFEHVEQSEQRDSFPALPLLEAEAFQRIGNYTAAIDRYELFLANEIGSEEERQGAERQMINSEWAADLISRPKDIDFFHIPGEVNSADSDFAPFFQNGELFFSTLRFKIKKDEVQPARKIAKVLKREGLEEEANYEELSLPIDQDERMVAHSAFNKAGDAVFYTICDYKGTSVDFRCEIYCSAVDADREWGRPQRLPINDRKATNTQPNVATLPDGKEYLYFVSDREGGKGGLDIYYSEILGDAECGPVKPLNDVNTAGDDITPFYYEPTQVFYFSTNGMLTLGGYDVYRTPWNGIGFSRPSHMGIPVNSSYDDLYYSRFPDQEEAYYASNRPDSSAIFWDDNQDVCCYDIYRVGISDEIRLLATTWHAIDLTELDGTTVTLYELLPNGERREVKRITNPTANDFKFTVVPGKKYQLEATKPGFTLDRQEVDLTDPELADATEIERKLYLSPDIELDVFTFNKEDNADLEGATVYLYELTPDDELILVDSVVNPLANDFHFKLRRGKRYTVVGRKDGFLPDMTVVDTNDPEFEEVAKIRRDLFLKNGLILEVYTFKLRDEKPLTGATVYLFEYTDEDGEKLVDSLSNPYGHLFGFEVEKGKRYVIRGERFAYGPDEASLDLSGPEVPLTGTYRRDLYLGQLLEIYTFDAVSELPLPGAEIKLIDEVTGEVVADKINPESNDFRFSIALDKPYKIEVTRKGYAPVTEVLTFTQQDLDEGGGKIVFDVFMEPYTSPSSMLPLLLYFDNDQPNPRSRRTTTDVEYISTNVEYYGKQQQFIQSITEGMELEEAFKTRRRYADFFRLEVRGGRYDLEEFAKRLLVYLEDGNTYEIELRGFASPRASSDYNNILSKRRISSVKNFFERYEDGALLEYIRIGALQYEEEPLGETQADPRVKDDLNDPKNSIYNVFASLERRVEVRSLTDDEDDSGENDDE